MATRTKAPAPEVADDEIWSGLRDGAQLGGTLEAWLAPAESRLSPAGEAEPQWISPRGAYGLNHLILLSHGSGGERIIYRSVRTAPRVTPLLLDCVYRSATVSNWDEPPAYEGALLPVVARPYMAKPGPDMKAFCINRHSGGVNGLFLDACVRKVGLKELWTLQWSPDFWTKGLWTAAGGVLPVDWPPWMRRFEDYGTPRPEMRQR